MKYIKQFFLIILISFMGELLHQLLPLPVPASIYGMVLMLLGLTTRIIPLEAVKDTGKFLVDIMAIMFIPASVGLMVTYESLQAFLVPFLVIVLTSTVLVMGVTGRITQWIIRREKREEAGS